MTEVLSFLNSLKEHQNLIYGAIFIISFFESFAFIGEFVPGAVFMAGSGYIASKGIINIYIAIFIASIGAIFADISSFFLALWFYEDIKDKSIVTKNEGLLKKGEEFFKKHGGKSVFFGRFVGALRPIVPFLAGVFKMKKRVFMFWAITSGILWGISYVGVGYFFGSNWNYISALFHKINVVAFVVLIVVVAFFVFRKKHG